MSEHQKQTAFLRQCLLYDDTVEHHKLEQNITQLQGNERCVRRAVFVMALLVALAMAGHCYSATFLTDRRQNMSQFLTQFISKVFCVLGLGSLMPGVICGSWSGLSQGAGPAARGMPPACRDAAGVSPGQTSLARRNRAGNLVRRIDGVKQVENY